MKTRSLLSVSFAAVALWVTGCASSGSGYKQAGGASVSIQKAAQSIHKGNGQIDAVLFALTGLVNEPGPDLKPQFEKFDAAVDRLASLSRDVSQQAAAMQTDGAAYVQRWDREIAKIQSEDIRSRSLDRKNAMAARFDRVRVGYVETKADFVPFMSDMRDIRTALATDLTVAGVASIRPVANKANANVLPLRESLSRLEADFKALGLQLSTANPSAAAR